MSFNPANPPLKDYYKAMQRAVKRYDSSFECKSLHDITGSFKISDKAMENIRKCRLAIIDLNENKPNVYYELGYVHPVFRTLLAAIAVQNVAAECLNIAKQPPRAA